MKKKIFCFIVIMIFLCSIVYLYTIFYSSYSYKEKISKDLNINTSDAKIVYSYDTHSGNGDGISCVIIKLDKLDIVKRDVNWNKFPISETVKTFVYGKEDGVFTESPFKDSEGKNLVPEIKNGYYCLIDRQSNYIKKKQPFILARTSYNATIGLYDLDFKLLYLLKIDT